MKIREALVQHEPGPDNHLMKIAVIILAVILFSAPVAGQRYFVAKDAQKTGKELIITNY